MNMYKSFFICHNSEDAIFLQEILLKYGISWTSDNNYSFKIHNFQDSWIKYPVYMGCDESINKNIRWFESYELNKYYNNHKGCNLFDIRILQRRMKLEKLNEI